MASYKLSRRIGTVELQKKLSLAIIKKTKLIQSDRCNKNDCVCATWYAGVLACDLNMNLANPFNIILSDFINVKTNKV